MITRERLKEKFVAFEAHLRDHSDIACRITRTPFHHGSREWGDFISVTHSTTGVNCSLYYSVTKARKPIDTATIKCYERRRGAMKGRPLSQKMISLINDDVASLMNYMLITTDCKITKAERQRQIQQRQKEREEAARRRRLASEEQMWDPERKQLTILTVPPFDEEEEW